MDIRVARRPLVGLVVSFMGGVWSAFALESSIAAGALLLISLVGLTSGLAAWGLVKRSRPQSRGWLGTLGIHLSVILIGHILALREADEYNGSTSARPAEHVSICGVIAGDPVTRVDEQGSRVSFPLDVQTICPASGEARSTPRRLNVTWFGEIRGARPVYGQRWVLGGILTTISGSPGETMRSVMSQSRPGRKAAVPCLQTSRQQSRLLADTTGWQVVPRACYELRSASARYLTKGIEEFPEHAGLLQALLLGSRQQLSPRMADVFAATGTLHIFAISGLHVGIVGLLAVLLLRSCRVSRRRWILVLGPVLLTYTLATGARASAIRACVMGIVYFMAPMLGRKSDVFTSLALAAFLVLAMDPSQLMEVGFILSFSVVTGLVVLYPFVMRPIEHLCQADPMIPAGMALSASLRQRVTRWILKYACSLAALSAAAWLISAPLTAGYFGRLSPVALVSNVIVIPLNFLMVLSGCLSMLIGPCVALIGEVFNHANLVLIHLTVGAMEILAGIPGGNFQGCWLPSWAIWGWYLGLAAVLLVLKSRSHVGENSCDGEGEMLGLPGST